MTIERTESSYEIQNDIYYADYVRRVHWIPNLWSGAFGYSVKGQNVWHSYENVEEI